MTIKDNKNKHQNNSLERKALIIASIFLLGVLANLLLSLSLGIKTGAWQQYTRAGLLLIFSTMTITAIIWIRSERIESGIWLIISGFLFAISGTSVLLAGLGLILAAITILLVTVAALSSLPQKQGERAIAISIFVAFFIIGFDFIPLSFRLPAPESMKTLIPVSAATVMLLAAFALFVQMALKNYLMRAKLTIALLTTSVLTSIFFVAFFFFSGSYATLEGQITNEQQNQLAQHVNGVEQAIATTQIDIIFLSQSTNVKQYIRAVINKKDKEEIASLREELDAGLLAFAQTHPNYAQLRFIDSTGQEISRVDNDREGNSTIISLSELQNKFDRYYFVESISLPKGEIYMSQLDLNVENGEIEVPHKPMLRLATPVVINNQTYGEIVLNLYAESFLAQLGETQPFAFLVDRDGYYLYHLDKNKRWGHLPELAQNVFSQDTGVLETDEQLFTYKSFTVSGETVPRWYIVGYRSADEAFAPLTKVLNLSVWLILTTLLLVAGIAAWISQTITKSLGDLTNTAIEIAEGNLSAEADTQSKDEIGILANAFNNMTSQLRNMVDTLELRVSNRTFELEQRSSYLETSAKVSHAITAIIEADKIINESVNIIQQNFNFYYVGLFLIDKQNERAILQAGTGEAGRIMLDRKHSLKIGEGMIGWSIANAKARIALDVGEDAVQFTNPDLPETRSEGALPLRSRGRVLGALTVQSTEESAFNPESITALQTMADQIAVALDNAKLFAESRDALEAERRAYGQLSQEDWRALLQRKNVLRYISDTPDESYSTEDEDSTNKAHLLENEKDDDLTRIIPIKIRGHVLGGIKLHKENKSDTWTKEELELARTLAEQVSISLESARLFDQSQRRAAHEHIIGNASAKMRETLDIESVLQTTARELRDVLGVSAAEVWIGTEDTPKNNKN